MKLIKTMLLSILCLMLFIPVTLLADDNASGGSGSVGGATGGYGYYNSGEYMYKVSVYVGLSDKAKTSDPDLLNFRMIGNAPIYVKPSTFALPGDTKFGSNSKANYLAGAGFGLASSIKILEVPSLPPPPVTSGGNITSIKEYFGSSQSLNSFINAFAQQKGTTPGGLVSGLNFTLNGVTGTVSPDRILPVKGSDGTYKNEVSWLIIYEPVIIAHLKDGVTKLAFTATEYALAQKLGYFNFGGGSDGQMITAMTHRALPNSITLEKKWFGFPVTPALAQGVNWANERIIQGGGWGMRCLGPHMIGGEDDPAVSIDGYYVDSDVITHVEVSASSQITPDAPVTVHFSTSTGQSGSQTLVIPAGGSQLAWFRWHTPTTPGNVDIYVTLSGNGSANIEGSSSAIIHADIIEIPERIPPKTVLHQINPYGQDQKAEGWEPVAPRVIAQRTSTSWGVWSAYWLPNWVWESDWWQDPNTGEWYDDGSWVDYGDWQYEWTGYSATLNTDFQVSPYKPGERTPTAYLDYGKWVMKSGYGVSIRLETQVTSNAPSQDIVQVQMADTAYPEFEYKSYDRFMEKTNTGSAPIFELKHEMNQDHFEGRVHFTPIWWPNNVLYIPRVVIYDAWTPVGMLTVTKFDQVNIQGSVTDDYHIAPSDPKAFDWGD